MRNKTKKSKSKAIIPLVILLVIVSVLGIFSSFMDARAYKFLFNNFNLAFTKQHLAVHFVYVGQGDGIAINLPNGKTLLIDAGPPAGSSTLKNYVSDKVVANNTGNDIDYLLLTHADEDHIGGALTILKTFDVGLVFLPKISKNTKVFNNLVDYIENNNISSTTDYTILQQREDIIDVYTLQESFSDTNDACPIVKIGFAGQTFLFTGDLPDKVEKKFVDEYGDKLDADILKVGHHGSATSSCAEFLEVVTPEYAVISCGIDNKFKHPTQEALDRLADVGAKILRTDKQGNILFVVGEKYGLGVLTGNYSVFGFEFRFVYLVVCVDAVLLLTILIVVLSKQKGKNA